MRKLAGFLCAALFLLGSAPTALVAQSPPPNVKLNSDVSPFLQNEEQVWINLTDSLNIVADWRDWRLGFRRVGVGLSLDGGATWLDWLITGRFDRQSDPCMVGDQYGTFYMNMLDYQNAGPESQISVFRSTTGGTSWTGPFAVAPLGPYFEDKQFTAVDRTEGPHNGNYYVSWTRFPNPDRMIFARSTDGGITFDDTVTIGPVVVTACGVYDQGQFSIPIVNSDGSVHVFWQGGDWDSAQCIGYRAIRRVRSTDGGVTFTQDSLAFYSSLGYWDVDGNIDVYGMPNGDADISGGPYDGNIYISRTEFASDETSETNVVVHKSTDNGITWLDTVTVNDDPAGQNIDQFHPWLIVNEDGTILTIFYDQRMDPVGHYLFDCYFSASFDGAETFIHNYRLSSVSSSPANLASVKNLAAARSLHDPYPGGVNAVPLAPMAGLIAEYIAVHAKHDYAIAVWTDTRHGTQDVYSARFTIPFMPPRLYLPEDGSQTPSATPSFRWSTCWHETMDSYRLEISADPGFGTLEQNHPGLTDNNFTPGTALSGGTHYWRVKAFRTAGDSTDYSEVFAITTGCQAGAAPVLTAPAAGDTVDSRDLALEWDDVLDAIEYRLQLSTESDFSSTVLDTPRTTSYLWVSDLDNQTRYYWRVNSTNACAPGDWAASDFYVLCQPAPTPNLVSPAADDTLDADAALFDWDALPGVNGYRLQLSTDPGFSSLLVDTALTASQYTATGLNDSTTYYWRVNSTNDCATGAWATGQFTILVCLVTLTGDVNTDGVYTAADIVYLVAYVFKSAPPPLPIPEAGDVTCDGTVTSQDIIYMVGHVFKSQPPPCDVCTIL